MLAVLNNNNFWKLSEEVIDSLSDCSRRKIAVCLYSIHVKFDLFDCKYWYLLLQESVKQKKVSYWYLFLQEIVKPKKASFLNLFSSAVVIIAVHSH